jgi:hypothetical protein
MAKLSGKNRKANLQHYERAFEIHFDLKNGQAYQRKFTFSKCFFFTDFEFNVSYNFTQIFFNENYDIFKSYF